ISPPVSCEPKLCPRRKVSSADVVSHSPVVISFRVATVIKIRESSAGSVWLSGSAFHPRDQESVLRQINAREHLRPPYFACRFFGRQCRRPDSKGKRPRRLPR